LLPVLNADGRSLMYKRNNRGPRIEPCGTPYLTVPQSEQHFYSHYYTIQLFVFYFPDRTSTMCLFYHRYHILPICLEEYHDSRNQMLLSNRIRFLMSDCVFPMFLKYDLLGYILPFLCYFFPLILTVQMKLD
jgi:hypothetical protein